jgi:hypothetical protein
VRVRITEVRVGRRWRDKVHLAVEGDGALALLALAARAAVTKAAGAAAAPAAALEREGEEWAPHVSLA